MTRRYVDIRDGEVYDVGEPLLDGSLFGDAARGPDSPYRLVEDFDPGESLTLQGELPESDLNTLVRRWQAGQPMPAFKPAQFGDVSAVADMMTIQQRLIDVRAAFMTLPADVRLSFGNNPLELAEFLSDPANVDEARQLGLFGADEPEGEASPAKPADEPPKGQAAPDKAPEAPRQV